MSIDYFDSPHPHSGCTAGIWTMHHFDGVGFCFSRKYLGKFGHLISFSKLSKQRRRSLTSLAWLPSLHLQSHEQPPAFLP